MNKIESLAGIGLLATVAVVGGKYAFDQEAQRVKFIGKGNNIGLYASCHSLQDEIRAGITTNPGYTRVASIGDVRFLGKADQQILDSEAQARGANMPARIIFSLDDNSLQLFGIYKISEEALSIKSSDPTLLPKLEEESKKTHDPFLHIPDDYQEKSTVLDQASGILFCPTNIPSELTSEAKQKVKDIVSPIIHPDYPRIKIEATLPEKI